MSSEKVSSLSSPSNWSWHFNDGKNRLYVTVKTAAGVNYEGALPLGRDLLVQKVLQGTHAFTSDDVRDYLNFRSRLADFSFKSDEMTYLALNATALKHYTVAIAKLDQCFASLMPEAEARTPEVGEVVTMYPGYNPDNSDNGKNFQVVGVDEKNNDCYCMLISRPFFIKPKVQMNRGACVKVSPTRLATIGYIRRHPGRFSRKVALYSNGFKLSI